MNNFLLDELIKLSTSYEIQKYHRMHTYKFYFYQNSVENICSLVYAFEHLWNPNTEIILRLPGDTEVTVLRHVILDSAPDIYKNVVFTHKRPSTTEEYGYLQRMHDMISSSLVGLLLVNMESVDKYFTIV